MKKTILIIAVILLLTRTSANSQQLKLDSTFRYNFAVLDSVASGTKKQGDLTHGQTAFLYLINDWSDNTAKYNHNSGFIFKPDDVRKWRAWYLKHAKEISLPDFLKADEIQNRLYREGVVPDSDLEYLNKLANKYKALK